MMDIIWGFEVPSPLLFIIIIIVATLADNNIIIIAERSVEGWKRRMARWMEALNGRWAEGCNDGCNVRMLGYNGPSGTIDGMAGWYDYWILINYIVYFFILSKYLYVLCTYYSRLSRTWSSFCFFLAKWKKRNKNRTTLYSLLLKFSHFTPDVTYASFAFYSYLALSYPPAFTGHQ